MPGLFGSYIALAGLAAKDHGRVRTELGGVRKAHVGRGCIAFAVKELVLRIVNGPLALGSVLTYAFRILANIVLDLAQGSHVTSRALTVLTRLQKARNFTAIRVRIESSLFAHTLVAARNLATATSGHARQQKKRQTDQPLEI